MWRSWWCREEITFSSRIAAPSLPKRARVTKVFWTAFPREMRSCHLPLVLLLAPGAAHRRQCQAPGAALVLLALPTRPSSASWAQAPVELCFLQFPIELLSLLLSVAAPLPFVCIPL